MPSRQTPTSRDSSLGDTNFDAVIVGAGIAGLYMLHRLLALKLRVRVFEAGSGVGGTWFWNRYPGARCDIESMEYSYSFSNELQQEWRWTQKYAEQPEILKYLNHVADRFNLRPHIQFNTRVVSQTYDQDLNLWLIKTSDGQTTTARFCVMASGNLSTPRVPDFKGLERFKGEWYHSGLWPEQGVDFSGKLVALIGTGSTGIQMTPKIAEQAKQLYVFQRTANFSVPARNTSLDPEVERSYKANYPERRQAARQTGFGVSAAPMPTQSALERSAKEREQFYESCWQHGGSVVFLTAYKDLLLNTEANDTVSEFVRQKIRSTVRDPATAELLAPKDHPMGTKRLCVDTEYFETFNRDNVTLVDARSTPIEEITPAGVRTTNAEYAVDAIAFATGFDAMTGAMREIDISGVDGQKLSEKWAFGPKTYLGLMVSGFPNLFIITGPGSPSVKSNMVCSIEQHVEWIADCIAYLDRHRLESIEASDKAEQDWVAHVNEVANKTLYPVAASWYSGSNIPGKPRVFMPYVGGLSTYNKICEDVVADRYRGFVLVSERHPHGHPLRQKQRSPVV